MIIRTLGNGGLRSPNTRTTKDQAQVMNSSTEDEIVSISKQKWDWMSAQDVAPLAALFNEAAVFVHMGATFSKEQELDVIKTGRIHYRDVDIKDVSVRFVGSAAIVLTTLQLGSVVDGKRSLEPLRRHRGLRATSRRVDPGVDVLHAARHAVASERRSNFVEIEARQPSGKGPAERFTGDGTCREEWV